ncbi:MAG: urea transporter [Oculatellaceae cyanobacterium bins.114]|nr:urea transporter [Oculatellaceae cyanobacterium bins.114]
MLDLHHSPPRWRYLKVATPTHSATQLWSRFKAQTPFRLFRAICAATAEILFLRGVSTGAFLLAAMLLQPPVLILGLTAVLTAVVFSRLVQLEPKDCNSLELGIANRPPLLFNPLLAGLGVGYLFQLSVPALFLAATAGVLAFLLTWTLAHILKTFLWLPVLSLPFILVSWVVHLAAFHYAGLDHAILPAHAYTIGLPLPLEGFLRALGLIFFLPNVWVGMVVALLLFLNSRIQFLLAIASYVLGTVLRGVLTGTFDYVYYDPAALNFILVALAIGGFYLLPSPRSYLLAAIATTLVALLSEAIGVFWAAVGLPVHALPYNLVTMLLLYLLTIAGNRSLVRIPQTSPEKTLDVELTARQRYQGSGRAIALPFAGRWSVWQGCNGVWTHQGLWRYAYDFVIQDEQGKAYSGTGTQITDYYAFQKPVLSPIRGWVVRVVNDLPDCAIGAVDADHNWGNHVVLYDERGFYVEISHFAQNSIVVKQGDRINRGAFIGRCGNSGFSPQPHIHIQVQLTPEVGAATVPFSFANLRVDDIFHTEVSPAEHTVLEAMAPDQALAQSLTFPLDTQLHFWVVQKERAIATLTLTNRMAIDGSFYFDSGSAKLFYSRDQDGFMCHRLEGHDPALAMLLIALPKLPLVHQAGLWWDYLPISTVTTGLRCMAYQFGSSFFPRLAFARYAGQWQSDSTLVGVVTIPGVSKKLSTAVTFDRTRQLVRISVGDRSLVRQ